MTKVWDGESTYSTGNGVHTSLCGTETTLGEGDPLREVSRGSGESPRSPALCERMSGRPSRSEALAAVVWWLHHTHLPLSTELSGKQSCPSLMRVNKGPGSSEALATAVWWLHQKHVCVKDTDLWWQACTSHGWACLTHLYTLIDCQEQL